MVRWVYSSMAIIEGNHRFFHTEQCETVGSCVLFSPHCIWVFFSVITAKVVLLCLWFVFGQLLHLWENENKPCGEGSERTSLTFRSGGSGAHFSLRTNISFYYPHKYLFFKTPASQWNLIQTRTFLKKCRNAADA